MKPKWNRGDTRLILPNAVIPLPAPLLWLDQLPDGRLIVTTLFDEQTSVNQTNAFVYDSAGRMETEIRIEENGRLVRFLGSEQEDGEVRLLGANEFKYTMDPLRWVPKSSQYYR